MNISRLLAASAALGLALAATLPEVAPAADLALAPFSKAPAAAPAGGNWFGLVWGLEGAGSIERHSFDLNAGSGSVDIGGARVTGTFGPEWKNQYFMVRLLGGLGYDFARGGATCMTAAGQTRCDVASGLVLNERFEVGIPVYWLGGITLLASVGAEQNQTTGSIGPISARQFENSVLFGTGFSAPIASTSTSVVARWDRVGSAQSIGLGTPVALGGQFLGVLGPEHKDVVSVGLYGKF